jgi:NitT/TauT family transport system substrate-binding protein
VKGGAKYPKFLYAWDAGFDAYTVLFANRPWAEKNADKLQALPRRLHQGMEGLPRGRPGAGARPDEEAEPEQHRRVPRLLPEDDHRREAGDRAERAKDDSLTGRISRSRFALQIHQLEELGILPKGKLKVDQVMTTEYLP